MSVIVWVHGERERALRLTTQCATLKLQKKEEKTDKMKCFSWLREYNMRLLITNYNK